MLNHLARNNEDLSIKKLDKLIENNATLRAETEGGRCSW